MLSSVLPVYDAVSLGNRFLTFLRYNMPSPSMVWGTNAHSVARGAFSKVRYYCIQYITAIFLVLHTTRGLGSSIRLQAFRLRVRQLTYFGTLDFTQ